MKWPLPHTVVEEDRLGRLVGESRLRAAWGERLFCAIWVGFWVVSLVLVTQGLDGGQPSLLPALAGATFLAIWIPAGIFMAWRLVSGFAGTERVVLDEAVVEVRRSVGPLGLRRQYNREAVGDFRVLSAQFLNERGFLVAFTCGRRTVRFGNGMNREQAEAVAQAFASRVRSLDGFARLDDAGPGPITFGHRSSWWAIGFIYSWLTCFSVGLTLAWQNSSPQGWEHIGWIAAFVFVAWVAGGFALLPFQRHVVSVRAADLEIKRGFGPVGRTCRYDRSDICNLRAVPVETEDGPAEDDFELAFDSGGETVRFGLSLTRAEAEATTNTLTERLHLV
jgi:hypothetical protein